MRAIDLAALRRRLNVKLNPLVAIGIGLGLVALLLPGPRREGETHSEEEILARLADERLDLDHGPRFWLREMRRGSGLYAKARQLCAAEPAAERPNCRLLASLERAGRDGEPSVDLGVLFPVPPPSEQEPR
jgi:hypothetical protein